MINKNVDVDRKLEKKIEKVKMTVIPIGDGALETVSKGLF